MQLKAEWSRVNKKIGFGINNQYGFLRGIMQPCKDNLTFKKDAACSYS